MPSGKSKEDTWRPDELTRSLKGAKDDKKKKSKKDDGDDKKHKKKRDEGESDKKDREHRDKDKKERKHRDKENGAEEDREKRKSRHRDEDEDRERRREERKKEKGDKDDDRRRKHRDEDVRKKPVVTGKVKAGEKDEERRRRKEEKRKERGDKDEDKEKHRRHKEDDEGDDRRRKHRDDDDREKRRKHRDEDDDKERRRKHRDDDDDRERRRKHRDDDDDDKERRRKHRDEDGDKEKRRKHRDEDDDKDKRRKHRDEEDDGERRKKHRDKDKKDDRDEDRERSHRRHRDENGERDKDRRRKHHDRDDDDDREHRRRQRDREEEDEERRHRRHRDEEDKDSRRQRQRDQDEEDKDRRHRRREEEPIPGPSAVEVTNEEEESKKEDEGGADANGNDEDDADEYNYDDDDFEDYDDDFEDDDQDDEEANKSDQSSGRQSPSYYRNLNWDVTNAVNDDDSGVDSREEVDEIMRAVNAENDRLLASSRRSNLSDATDQSEEAERPQAVAAPKRNFINFVSAKQRQVTGKAANKVRRRGDELLKMIELDEASYDLFDMPPVREYDLYIRSFGRSDTKQAYVQTNDDNLDREIQTEEIDQREKWTQHPPDDFKGCGGGDLKSIEEEEEAKNKTQEASTAQLGKFVQKAGQVMSILLEESLAEKSRDEDNTQKQASICVSEGFTQLGQIPLLTGRHVTYSVFSTVQTNLLLTVYNKPEESQDEFGRRGIICVWNVNEPSRPQKILVCESQPTCCCFSPNKSTLVFAGMYEGSLCVWDLREPSSMHKKFTIEGEEWLLRYPTYNTAGVLHYDNHQGAVMTVAPIVTPEDSASASLVNQGDSDGSSGLNFQLASVDDAAIVNLWVVAEIPNPNQAGSESDLGLAPGGRIKVLKSSSVSLKNPAREQRLQTTMRAFEMQLFPPDPSHFYVGTDTGCVVHGVRFGGKTQPRAFRPGFDSMVDVSTLDFSPFSEPVLLVGCVDGSLRLHSVHSENPVLMWPNATEGRAIQCVRWCRSRPSVFFVLDESSNLYIWDLLMNDAVPMKEEKVSADSVVSLCLCNDHSATGLGMPGRRPQMAVSLESGLTEIHNISREFSALMADEVDRFAAYLEGLL